MILLGTNIRITIIINNKPPAVLARFQQYRLQESQPCKNK
jgi:hypothetical protein